ncbi:CRPV-392 [Crowpox virus]|nr:CRPV-392 [Crowpox virus]
MLYNQKKTYCELCHDRLYTITQNHPIRIICTFKVMVTFSSTCYRLT